MRNLKEYPITEKEVLNVICEFYSQSNIIGSPNPMIKNAIYDYLVNHLNEIVELLKV